MCKLPHCLNNDCHWCKRRNKPKTPIKRTPIKKKPCKIKRVSDKRGREEREYSKLRKKFLNEHKICECGCGKEANDVHHSAGRGKYFLDVTTWKALNRLCHIWATEHTAEAIEKGLSKRRNTHDRGKNIL